MQHPVAFHKNCGGRVQVRVITKIQAYIDTDLGNSQVRTPGLTNGRVTSGYAKLGDEEFSKRELICDICNCNITQQAHSRGLLGYPESANYNLTDLIEARDMDNDEQVIEIGYLEGG